MSQKIPSVNAKAPLGGAHYLDENGVPMKQAAAKYFRDPSTSKPYKKGTMTPARVQGLLMLVGYEDLSIGEISSWSEDQLIEAGNWAWRSHLRASDNNSVRVPERPSFLPADPPTRIFDSTTKTVMDL